MQIKVAASSRVSRRGTLFVPLFPGRAKQGIRRFGVTLSGVSALEKAGDTLRIGGALGGFDAVVAVSLGKRSECTAEHVRRAGGTMARCIHSAKTTTASVDLADVLDACPDDGVAAVCEGLELGAFRFTRYKKQARRPPNCRVTLLAARPRKGATADVARAQSLAAAVNLAREVGHEPANSINPVTLAARARKTARACGLKCTVLTHQQMHKLRMHAMLAVGKGSATPPRLIVLEYGAHRRGKPVVLVGKAITFDTGGYSLKDREGIVGMKYDKCGGMAVLGTMQAVATLKPNVPVVGIIAAAENMISGEAYRPNDIITAMSGKTIEIISTDAEGRLVLADALTYAQRKYQPRAMIDIATLTGGVVVALGGVYAGLFTAHDALREALVEAGRRTHERLWHLPLDDDYFELIKADDCDIKNSGGREAHAVIGGMFLKQFVEDAVPWAHLDIAGTATIDKDGPYCPKGATGFGVRLLCDYIERL